MTGENTRPPFRIDTELIPEGVNESLALQRNGLIALFRAGEANSADTHKALLMLYWQTQDSANGETKMYLMSVSYEFPVEAGLPHNEAEEIYEAAYEQAQRDRAAAVTAATWPVFYT